jgi:hypothetical protein
MAKKKELTDKEKAVKFATFCQNCCHTTKEARQYYLFPIVDMRWVMASELYDLYMMYPDEVNKINLIGTL